MLSQVNSAFSPAETGSRVLLWGEPDDSPYKTCRRGGACDREEPPQTAGVIGEGKRRPQLPCPYELILLLSNAAKDCEYTRQ